ncbi:DUF333 domain-containing protein [Nanoarchaeota archaeon]
MRKEILICVLVLLLLVLVGCGSAPQKYMLSKEDAQQKRVIDKSQVANPASLHCMNTTGATLQMKEGHGGTFGICTFSDGSWCEEWAYYHEWCSPGTNLTVCGDRFAWESSCDPDYNPVCGKVWNNLTKVTKWERFSNACSACIGSEGADVVQGYVMGECE